MAKLDKLITQAAEHMNPGEEVRASVMGTYETKKMGQDWTRSGALIATDRRLVFYAKKLGGYDFESFPYENISSFEESKSMMGHTLSFHASDNKTSMKWIKSDDDFRTFVNIVRDSMGKLSSAPATASTPAPAADAPPDVMAQIKQLAELHAAGILTDEEFHTNKAELLSRL